MSQRKSTESKGHRRHWWEATAVVHYWRGSYTHEEKYTDELGNYFNIRADNFNLVTETVGEKQRERDERWLSFRHERLG